MKQKLNSLYRRLYRAYGKQHWWPADSAFEVMVGAILTQNTSWQNVEKAIGNLKKKKLLSPEKLRRISLRELSLLIRPAGYYNLKAGRLKNFLDFLMKEYRGDLSQMRRNKLPVLRRQLLSVNGIGPETADSILLYALEKPSFVVDAYTRRILFRQRLIQKDAGYDQIRNMFMSKLKKQAPLFNEYHALLVRLAKESCLKNSPKCLECPVRQKRPCLEKED